MAYPDIMTLNELIKQLQDFQATHGDKEINIWLPGMYIQPHCVFFLPGKDMMIIEGNEKPR